MSDVFALDTAGQQALEAEVARNPVGPEELSAGSFRGVGTGVGQGFMRGGARVGQFIGMAGGAVLSLQERYQMLEPGTLTDPYFRSIDAHVNSAVDYWTPNAAEVGTAGRVLGGLTEAALPLMAGGGNPALLIGTQEIGTATDLTREGVGAGAAVGVGAAQGAAAAVGFRIPFLGRSLLTRAASGAVGNLAVNAGTTAAQRKVLEAANEDEAAKQFNYLDPEARAVDLLTGIAFGGIEHVRVRGTERAAAAAAANARHFQEQTAPGVPADVHASVAHTEAMEQAITQLLNGDPVTAPKKVLEANFVPHEFVAESMGERAAALKDEGITPPDETRSSIPFNETLRPAERVIEARFSKQIEGDVDTAMRQYAELPESKGGRVLNTDVARELSADYRADRTQSAAVHEPASWLVKQMYTRMLAQKPGPGQEARVLFTGGGTGAGKSTAIGQLASELEGSAQIVYDTNLNGLQSSISKIEQALQAGKDVEILYVARDPVQALKAGALPRAMRMGRTVPLVEHARTHVGSVETIQRIAEHYEDDPRVHIEVIDNNHGKGKAAQGSLEKLPKNEYDAVLGKLYDALRSELEAGRISDTVYRGTLADFTPPVEPRPNAGTAKGAGPKARAGGSGQSESTHGGQVTADDPLTAYLRERLQESDIRVPTGAVDEDGAPVTRSAREQLAEIDAEIAEAEKMGRGIMAAVSCLIDRGVAA